MVYINQCQLQEGQSPCSQMFLVRALHVSPTVIPPEKQEFMWIFIQTCSSLLPTKLMTGRNQICLCSNGLTTQHGPSSQSSTLIASGTHLWSPWQCRPLTAEAPCLLLLVTGRCLQVQLRIQLETKVSFSL